MEETRPFHYPPDLFALLVDTIPVLCRSKRDVLQFFRGAGVSARILAAPTRRVDTEPAFINKFEIARGVLTALNEGGDLTLGPRREVLKRVVEFHDFSIAWPTDRLKAKGLVAEIRELVNVKDSFTRMADEREAERRERQVERERAVVERRQAREELARLHTDLKTLFVEVDHQRRGRSLEVLLNRLFEAAGILIRESFVLVGADSGGIIEQIDGVIEIDSHLYLVEVKWLGTALGVEEVSRHLVRVASRGHAAALIISASGFTAPAVSTCREALNRNMTVVLCELREILLLLEREMDLAQLLREKIHEAIAARNPLSFPLAAAS